MTLNNSCVLWPIVFDDSIGVSLGYYNVSVESDDPSPEALRFPALSSSPSTITSTRNYWVSGDSQTDVSDGSVNGHADLLKILKECLESHSSFETFTVALNSSFQCVITSSAPFVIHWDAVDTSLDFQIFGFEYNTYSSASVGGTQTLTSPNQVKGLWRPKKPIWGDSRARKPTVGGVSTSVSGLTRISQIIGPPDSKSERDLEWRFFAKTQGLKEYGATTEPYGTFEHAWERIVAGLPFRYYVDETTLGTSSSYRLYYTRDLEDPLVRNEEFQILWNTRLRGRSA